MEDVPPSLIQTQKPASTSEPIYNMTSTVSVKDDTRGEIPPVFEATSFRQSASLPNYYFQSQGSMGRAASTDSTKQVDLPMFSPIETPKSIHTNGQPLALPTDLLRMDLLQPAERNPASFLLTAADMEYLTLSNILQENLMGVAPSLPATSTEGTPNSVNMSPSPHAHGMSKSSPLFQTGGVRIDSRTELPQIMAPQNAQPLSQENPPCDTKINQYMLGKSSSHDNVGFPEVSQAIEYLSGKNSSLFQARNAKLTPSFAIGIPPNTDYHAGEVSSLFRAPEDIYARISKPFSYTPGYHKLIAYLRSRFPKDMLVKMAKSMAVYRPSFIACTNSLREADLIFMEQCFQRMLLTYDDFIKISGTPTIVWRRTGEIAYVGKEFTILTGWTRQQLMGPKPMFIVELLDDKSVLEYFQLFSKIAFGDFLGATMTECTLLTPRKDVKVRAGCIWTLKRDVFGIPMMIIGNFLPIV